MNRCEKYRQYFTGDCLMGPNPFRLLSPLQWWLSPKARPSP